MLARQKKRCGICESEKLYGLCVCACVCACTLCLCAFSYTFLLPPLKSVLLEQLITLGFQSQAFDKQCLIKKGCGLPSRPISISQGRVCVCIESLSAVSGNFSLLKKDLPV